MYIQKPVLIADKGPKTVKIFINQPRTLDFDSAESMASVQTLEYVFTKLIPFFLKYNLLTKSSILRTCLGNPFQDSTFPQITDNTKMTNMPTTYFLYPKNTVIFNFGFLF